LVDAADRPQPTRRAVRLGRRPVRFATRPRARVVSNQLLLPVPSSWRSC